MTTRRKAEWAIVVFLGTCVLDWVTGTLLMLGFWWVTAWQDGR